MKITNLPVSGLVKIDADPITDRRGSFSRIFCAQDLAPLLGERSIVQINTSTTRDVGAVRGLHFQYPPHAEMKFVQCLAGEVFDVAVDLRRGSPGFGQWCGLKLSADDNQILAIPEGFAHGFQVLKPESSLLYFHTAFYAPKHESGIRPDDPGIGIDWPLAIAQMSPRDEALPSLKDNNFEGIAL
mgnify:CR=1 FL=1